MLNSERVVLCPIQRGISPRPWELVSDFDVAVLGSSGPVVPRSLAQFEAGFDEDLTKDHNDRAYFGIDVDGELIGEAGLHRIDHFSRVCELGNRDRPGVLGEGVRAGRGPDAGRLRVRAPEHEPVGLDVLADDLGPSGRTARPGSSRKAGSGSTWVRGRYEDELVMAILREDWTPRT
jgi:RimJ/RimL family protein N-acetyltransferase